MGYDYDTLDVDYSNQMWVRFYNEDGDKVLTIRVNRLEPVEAITDKEVDALIEASDSEVRRIVLNYVLIGAWKRKKKQEKDAENLRVKEARRLVRKHKL